MTAAARRDPTRKHADILGGSLCGTSTSGLIILRHRAVASINIAVVNWGRLLTSSSRSLQQHCSFYRCFKAKIKAMSRDTHQLHAIVPLDHFIVNITTKDVTNTAEFNFAPNNLCFIRKSKQTVYSPKNTPFHYHSLCFFYSIFYWLFLPCMPGNRFLVGVLQYWKKTKNNSNAGVSSLYLKMTRLKMKESDGHRKGRNCPGKDEEMVWECDEKSGHSSVT